jgi:hypothetical protein
VEDTLGVLLSRQDLGSGSTDTNGGYSSRVAGAGLISTHVYRIRIDGDRRELTLVTRRMRGFMKRASLLHIGDKAPWNNNGSLEIQFHADSSKDEFDHETFYVQAEKKIENVPTN